MNRHLAKKHILLLFMLLPIYAEEQGDQSIDDREKISSRIGNMFSNPETLKRAQNATQGTATAITKGKEVKEAGGIKEFGKKAAKEVTNTRVIYDQTKGGIWNVLSKVANKTTAIMGNARERINRWQTTYPALEGFYEASKAWTNNTRRIYKRFKWKHLWDIERKYDRMIEDHVRSGRYTATIFGQFMRDRYTRIAAEMSVTSAKEDQKEYYDRLFRAHPLRRTVEDIAPEDIPAFIKVMSTINEHVLVPYNIFENAGETMWAAAEISEAYNGISESHGTTFENATFDTISNTIDADEATYDDQRQLSAFINTRRQKIAADRITISQLQANMEIAYGRLQLHDVELEQEQRTVARNELTNIIKPKIKEIE